MKRSLVALGLVCLSAVGQAQDASPDTLKQECAAALASEPDFSKPDDVTAKLQAAIDACKRAAEASPQNEEVQRSYASALLNTRQIAPAMAVLRPLADAGDAEALFTIFEIYDVRERGTDRFVVGRAAAEAALRQAAEARHPQAVYTLAAILHRGGALKRDPDAALLWAERAIENPVVAGDIRGAMLLGEILTTPSRSAEDRERGVEVLKKLVEGGAAEARVLLAKALRTATTPDLVRARALLEEAIQSENAAAASPLAAMLIAGEGGAKDPARALTLLRDQRFRSSMDTPIALARLHLDGKLVRREPRTAIALLEYPAFRDIDARMQLARLLTVYSNVRLRVQPMILSLMIEAADAGEPEAMFALMSLKLSRHDQFRDETGGYDVAEKLADVDDRALVRVLERRANWIQADASRRALWEGQIRSSLERLMNKGFAPAFTLHGALLRRGGVYPQDDVAATKSLLRAAELGDVDGMVLAAKAHDEGLGTPKNPREQIRWLREAAKRGSVDARRSLVWEARFDSARQLTLRDSITEQVALYNDQLGSISTQDFMGVFMQSRISDFQPKRVAQAIMDGYRSAPAGLAEDRMVSLMRQIPQQLRAEIETILKAEGHYKGDTQGYFGPEARTALAAWVDAGLGREAEPESKPAAPKTAALTPPAGAKPPSAGDMPEIPPEAFKTYWDRILAAFKGAKNQKDAREAWRMLIVMARGGNTQARNQLVKSWDDQALVRELVTPAEITLWGIDVIISKLPGMEKAKIEFIFNSTRIERTRQMQRWTDGFIVAVRDDPRLSDEGQLTLLLKEMIFVSGACEAIAARVRLLKLASVSADDGCGPVARDALLDLIKTQGTSGTEIKARVAAGHQLLKEVSGEKSEATTESPAGSKRRR